MHTIKSREKAEAELAEHIKKAVNPYETAPKQKHVRSTTWLLFEILYEISLGCIVFAWDYGTSLPFWASLKLHPILSDQIPCFKALITIHKLLVGGPHLVSNHVVCLLMKL